MKQRSKSMALQLQLTLSLLMLATASAWSQNQSTRQTLTLQVAELNRIDVDKKTITLRIAHPSESEFRSLPVANTARLIWTSNGDSRKITIWGNKPSPQFNLKAEVQNLSPGCGRPAGEVVLSGNTAHDLLVGFGRSSGSCLVKFTASPAEGSAGLEPFLIIYTITST